MGNDKINGAVQAGAGGYLAYQGIKHGLPRALGMRIEYHTTSKENAELIKKGGNILDPAFGGKGWSAKVNSNAYIKHSKNYVHVTGLHPESEALKMLKENKKFKNIPNCFMEAMRTFYRKTSCLMYKFVGHVDSNELEHLSGNKKGKLNKLLKIFKQNMFKSKTKKFCIAGTDSYFNKNFISDLDDPFAMKTNNKIKVANNRFSATVDGLKQFGLKGIKENKGRVAFGIGIISLATYYGAKLIKKGLGKIKNS